MKDMLLKRQAINDNVTKILSSSNVDVNQMSLFDNTSNGLIELHTTKQSNYVELLEAERDRLGLVLSVDYLQRAKVLIDLIKLKPVSQIESSTGIMPIIGVCVSIEASITKNGKQFYKIYIADSTRKIEVITYSKTISSQFVIGELYMLVIRINNFYNDNFILLLRHKVINENKLGSIFKSNIKLHNIYNVLYNNKKLSDEFLMYLINLTEEADGENSVKLDIMKDEEVKKTLDIKFDNEVYEKFINYFNFKITY
jgi:DNA polymerase III alpha subunit